MIGMFAFTACDSDVIDPIEPELTADGDLVIYSQTIQPIFNNSCSGSGCHIGERTSGVNLSSYNLAIESIGDQYGEFVIHPGKPTTEDSPIMDKLLSTNPQNGQQMPLDNPGSLTQEQLDAIFNWIDQGARNIDPNS